MAQTNTHQPELWLIRHGETEWSKSGAHTSFTELPLTDHGREQARALAPALASTDFALVLTSPRQRAQETAKLAEVHHRAEIEPNLQEWDYGDYEGLSTATIRETHPGWSVWKDPITNGETLEQVAARAQKVIDRCLSFAAQAQTSDKRLRIALFAHAHIFRILTGMWVQQGGGFGERIALSTATISILGWERATRVIKEWNVPPSAFITEKTEKA